MLIRILSLCFLVLLPVRSDAARLFTSGFEENDFTTAIWTATAGSPTISTSNVHSGTYSARINPTAAAWVVRRSLAAAKTSGTLYTGVSIYPVSFNNNTEILASTSSSAVGAWKLTLLTGGTLRLTNVVTAATFNSAYSIPTGSSTRIEVRHLISDTAGQIEVRLFAGDATTPSDTYGDGNFTGGDGSDADTLPTDVQRLYLGQLITTATCDIYYDDVAINDETGSFQTSWSGPRKIYLLTPNSDVSNTWENEAAGAATFAKIDDVPGPPDDLTTYNTEAVTLNSVDRFGLTNLGAEVPGNATIVLVDVYGRVGSTQISSTLMKFKLWDEGSTLTNGPNVNANVNGWKIVSTAEHQVYDATGKTKANLDSFNVGYENITDTATRERRVTALFANVEWIEAAGGATPHNLMLLGVGP